MTKMETILQCDLAVEVGMDSWFPLLLFPATERDTISQSAIARNIDHGRYD